MSKINTSLEEDFNNSQNALVIQQSDLSLKSISDMVESSAIDINPKYQRRKRWDEQKESDLIESFILNIPVPPVYLAEDAYGTYSVIDGKQRITAINRFLKGDLKLKNLEKFTTLENYTFSELPEAIQNALKIRPYLRVVTLLKQSDNDLKHEVFLRLNKAGVALNSQEIRNVAFRGKLNDLLFKLSENHFLRKRLKATERSKVYREMQDVQYVLRFYTVREYWNKFPGNMDIAMDNFMKTYHKVNSTKVKEYKKIFNGALTSCEKIWGENAFERPNGSSRVLQGFYDIQMVCLSLLSDKDLKKVVSVPKKVRKLLNDELNKNVKFSESITQFTSNPANIKNRISTFLELLRGI